MPDESITSRPGFCADQLHLPAETFDINVETGRLLNMVAAEAGDACLPGFQLGDVRQPERLAE